MTRSPMATGPARGPERRRRRAARGAGGGGGGGRAVESDPRRDGSGPRARGRG
jgi:hypothetical protein